MLDNVIESFLQETENNKTISSFVELNSRFIKEVQQSFAKVIEIFFNDVVFNQDNTIRLTVKTSKALELKMNNDFIDLTSRSTRSIELDPVTGVFSLDISINGNCGVYQFKSSDLLAMELLGLTENSEVVGIPLDEILTTLHERIMLPKPTPDVPLEELPENVVRGNFNRT